jgi:hypothetical protein
MKFTTGANANMTCLQGSMPARYDELVAVFGEPEGGGDKTTVEWCLAFEDGTVATIYDWKEYETPMYEYNWHIGGMSKLAVERVESAFRQGVKALTA